MQFPYENRKTKKRDRENNLQTNNIELSSIWENMSLTCGVQCDCAGESGLVWLFDLDFHIFFVNDCPTFVDDFDFCILRLYVLLCLFVDGSGSSFLWPPPNKNSFDQVPARIAITNGTN